MVARQLRIAAVQVNSQPGQLQAKLEHAAGLVLLPQLMPSGYMLTEDIRKLTYTWCTLN